MRLRAGAPQKRASEWRHRGLGVVGGVAIGLAGPLAQGLHVMQAGVLFLGGNLLALRMVWGGIRIIRSAVR